MATIQEQYAALVKQGQEAALAALETWNHTFKQAFSRLPGVGSTAWPVSPDRVIDQVYDFAGHVLDVQRDVAKQLVATGTAAADKVRAGAATTTGAGAAQQN